MHHRVPDRRACLFGEEDERAGLDNVRRTRDNFAVMSETPGYWWEVEDPRDVLDGRYDDHHELVVAVVDYEAEYGSDAVEELDITEYRPSATPDAQPEYRSVPAAHLL